VPVFDRGYAVPDPAAAQPSHIQPYLAIEQFNAGDHPGTIYHPDMTPARQALRADIEDFRKAVLVVEQRVLTYLKTGGSPSFLPPELPRTTPGYPQIPHIFLPLSRFPDERTDIRFPSLKTFEVICC